MKLKPYDIKKTKPGLWRKTKNKRILDEFCNSGLECAEVTGYDCKNAEYASTSLNCSIKRYCMTGIRSICRKGHVYLIRIDTKD